MGWVSTPIIHVYCNGKMGWQSCISLYFCYRWNLWDFRCTDRCGCTGSLSEIDRCQCQTYKLQYFGSREEWDGLDMWHVWVRREGVYRVLVGKPEGRRPLGRSRRRWVDNIRMDLQDAGCGYVDWIGLAQDRDRWRTLVSAVMNLRVPWNAGNLLTSCKPVSFSRRTLHHGVNKKVSK